MYAESSVRTYVSGTALLLLLLLLSVKANVCNAVVLTGIYEYMQQWRLVNMAASVFGERNLEP
jgi:hypothetical protein